jgi:hypothetical protein
MSEVSENKPLKKTARMELLKQQLLELEKEEEPETEPEPEPEQDDIIEKPKPKVKKEKLISKKNNLKR